MFVLAWHVVDDDDGVPVLELFGTCGIWASAVVMELMQRVAGCGRAHPENKAGFLAHHRRSRGSVVSATFIKCTWPPACSKFLFQPIHRLGLPENYLFFRSKHAERILYTFLKT